MAQKFDVQKDGTIDLTGIHIPELVYKSAHFKTQAPRGTPRPNKQFTLLFKVCPKTTQNTIVEGKMMVNTKKFNRTNVRRTNVIRPHPY
eukprot:scaffold1730_cov35-Tisochrysis_lutea.AAC.1